MSSFVKELDSRKQEREAHKKEEKRCPKYNTNTIIPNYYFASFSLHLKKEFHMLPMLTTQTPTYPPTQCSVLSQYCFESIHLSNV